MIYEAAEFSKQTSELRRRFTDPKNPHYLFDPACRYKKSVPMNGLFKYVTQIWDAVYMDEALNIPDQQKLLASWKGGEVMEEIMEDFRQRIAPIQKALETEPYPDLGSVLKEHVEACLEAYQEMCQGYATAEVAAKMKDLRDKMNVELKDLVMKQMDYIRKTIAQEFEKALIAQLPQSGCSTNFMKVVERALREAHNSFMKFFDKV